MPITVLFFAENYDMQTALHTFIVKHGNCLRQQ